MSNKSEIVEYMRSDTVMERFAEVLGNERNAAPYISSVLLSVMNNDALQKCSRGSIYSSALRAATLRLSCDPGTKQAYLVPYGKNATMIIGYKGLYDMAVRTGKYRFINTSKVYEGEELIFDRITGAARIEGNKESDLHHGWLASFEMTNGMSKTIYMSIKEIHDHAKQYSKGYNRKDSAWKTATEQMERKTVLRKLIMEWGYLDPSDAQHMSVDDEHYIDVEHEDIPEIEEAEQEQEKQSPDEIVKDLGFM